VSISKADSAVGSRLISRLISRFIFKERLSEVRNTPLLAAICKALATGNLMMGMLNL
jgi:hypothetical protein